MGKLIRTGPKAASCLLCGSQLTLFYQAKNKRYYRCSLCLGVFLDPACYLSKEDERKRYLEHNNDIEDYRYQKFVEPIVSGVKQHFQSKSKGLDFGAGTGPVISKLLGQAGYSVELYDPFFWDQPQKLETSYDFIVCCEVIEHFHSPGREFKLLKSLLKPKGVLFCMTDLYSERIDFRSWYYKNDPTHTFFYHRKTLAWLKSYCGFSNLKVRGRLIQFFADSTLKRRCLS